MERLARAILDTQKIREDSFDHKAADKAEKTRNKNFIDFAKFYKKSMMQAADEAAGNAGFDKQGTLPVYLLCQYCWNDIQVWAEQIISK